MLAKLTPLVFLHSQYAALHEHSLVSGTDTAASFIVYEKLKKILVNQCLSTLSTVNLRILILVSRINTITIFPVSC